MSHLKILLCIAAIFTGLATHALARSGQPRPQPAAAPELSGTCFDICIQQQCAARGLPLPFCVVSCKAQCGI